MQHSYYRPLSYLLPLIPNKSLPNSGPLAQQSYVHEPFIKICDDARFSVRMQYAVEGRLNSTKKCYVRQTVYEKLCCAHENLPSGFKFLIYDAWRPFDLQKELYDDLSRSIIESYGYQDRSDKEQVELISKFIAPPVKDPNNLPTHTTGGAVDLSLIGPDGEELDMGTKFDEMNTKSGVNAFEDTANELVKNNRRLLFHTMLKSGFTNLPSEWWHYDYGDRYWASFNRAPVMYGGVFSEGEIEIAKTK